MKKVYLILLLAAAMSLTGCASTGGQQGQVERITPDELAKLMPPPVATYTLTEVAQDSKAGKTPDEIIAKIKTSNSSYVLTPTQVLDLHKQGVDVKVLDYIQESYEKAKQNAIAEEINKREQEKRAAMKQLQRERALMYNRYYDLYGNPYYYPPWRYPYRYPYYPYYW